METEHIDPAALGGSNAYRLLTAIVTPRPIAWVSTLDAEGRGNLAPFSYFQAVSSRPPIIMLSVAFHGDGRSKDTLANILDRREFTISHVSEPLAQAMNETSAGLGRGESEWEPAGVTPAASTVVGPPRVAEARAALECRMIHALPVGEGRTGGPSTMLILGEVVAFHVQRGLVTWEGEKLRAPGPAQLQSVGRLGGPDYCRSTDVFHLDRPGSSGGKA